MRVGLTGGVASGKSTVAALLRELGAVVVDSDVLAREVVEPGTPGLAAVVEAFGPGVLTADGALDRPALGAVVFGDEAARRRLEAILHPLIRARAAELEAAAPEGTVVVHDIPLLVETDQAGGFDAVVVVDAPDDVRVARVAAGRGMTESEARGRIAAQATREQRLAVADHVVTNSGDLDALDRAVADLWRRLVGHQAAPAEH